MNLTIRTVNEAMERVSLKQQHDILLSMLAYVDSVCTTNDIPYSMGGGTLLGAVRHQGFIPWDDDIDIMLLRDHYTRLVEVLRKNSTAPYIVLDASDKGNPYAFAKLCDSRTFCKGPLDEVPEMGVFIDIFPVDFLPDAPEERRKFSGEMKRKQDNLDFYSWRTYSKASSYFKKAIKSVLYLPKYLYYGLLRSETNDKDQLVKQMSSYKDTGMVGFTGSPYSPEKEFFPTEIFSEYIRLKFEDHEFSAIAGYEKYLSQLYGDYMQLPPVGDRVNHSYYQWYWRS